PAPNASQAPLPEVPFTPSVPDQYTPNPVSPPMSYANTPDPTQPMFPSAAGGSGGAANGGYGGQPGSNVAGTEGQPASSEQVAAMESQGGGVPSVKPAPEGSG